MTGPSGTHTLALIQDLILNVLKVTEPALVPWFSTFLNRYAVLHYVSSPPQRLRHDPQGFVALWATKDMNVSNRLEDDNVSKSSFVNVPAGNSYWLQLRQIQERTCWCCMEDSGQKGLLPVGHRKRLSSTYANLACDTSSSNSYKRLQKPPGIPNIVRKVDDCTRF